MWGPRAACPLCDDTNGVGRCRCRGVLYKRPYRLARSHHCPITFSAPHSTLNAAARNTSLLVIAGPLPFLLNSSPIHPSRATAAMTVQHTADGTVAYLRSLGAVRDRSKQVYNLIVSGKADHWDWDESQMQNVVDFCAGLIEVRQTVSMSSNNSATLERTRARSLVSCSVHLTPRLLLQQLSLCLVHFAVLPSISAPRGMEYEKGHRKALLPAFTLDRHDCLGHTLTRTLH